MSPEKTNTLYRDFSLLYRDRMLPERESRMCDGFCCGDGWYNIIHEMSKELDMLFIKKMVKSPTFEYPSVFQVKEKFALLSVYLEGKDIVTFCIENFQCQEFSGRQRL